MAPETLEAIFVQREKLAERLVEFIDQSALTNSKHHSLLIGPRGIGKTHLVSIIYHRVKQLKSYKDDRLVIAWLREEEWGVMSFLDLLVRILRALIAEHQAEELEEQAEALYKLGPGDAERLATRLLKAYVRNRTLVIIVENLDDLFHGLEEEGQKRLRAYIQENPFLTILATSQSLFGGVSLQTSPFYGFFRINHLEELSLEDASELLSKIAELEGDDELASLIGTSLGRVRLRALQRLAGGNHRVYVIFSQFLTRESLSELIEALMRTLDELTPYYHERIRWLSPQQRKVVELLSDKGNALAVKEIAARCFMTQQTASAQLKLLREWGYVRTNPIGRQSYYELREPLMRLCVEVKKHRDEPIRLVVELLRSWYTSDELRKRLDGLPQETMDPRSERRHIVAALNQYQRAEVLVSLSAPEKIDQALLRLMRQDHTEQDRDIEVVSGALKRMGFLTIRRRRLLDDLVNSPEDVIQGAWLKLFESIKKNEFTSEQIENPSGYLYQIISEVVSEEATKHRRLGRKSISFDEGYEDRGQYLPSYLMSAPTPSPDELLDLRLRLLQYIQTYLFDAVGNRRELQRRLEELVAAVVGSGSEDVLSEALIKHFVTLVRVEGKELAAPQLKKWSALANQILGPSPEFELVLRVLKTVLEYLTTNDKRTLLELRLEERAFVDPLFDELQT